MRKEVLVTVRGTQTNEHGEQETIELVTMGNYYRKNSHYYILYNESDISGMAGTTTTLKVEPHRVTLNRMGVAEQKQIFEKDKPNEGNYVTPYGAMCIGVLPRKVEVDMTEFGGNINLEYELELERQKVSYNELTITVREV